MKNRNQATRTATMPPLLVTAAIIEENGLILVTQRPEGSRHAGKWEFPGGKMEPGESPRQALERELREELNLEISAGDIVETLYHRYPWGAVLILAYRCRIRGGTLQHLQVADHRWLPAEQLQGYDFLEADRPLVEKLRRDRPVSNSSPQPTE
ncbi:(deoxy)nucleoside triphosphate pyrophosphohydrolase [Geothermobacter hydrogeniphilus]|uniref:8-oxo-dGTP diphosphatase n=2 Tax=Geothermobacter hydrogeniphilus TaxID=1969733 RepID=A0A2K2HDH0_9BACT|nr:(deoxy)nucleoside triphosphate pyrophosphohydrolase [Geothermobacter hydrogeniphilus]